MSNSPRVTGYAVCVPVANNIRRHITVGFFAVEQGADSTASQLRAEEHVAELRRYAGDLEDGGVLLEWIEPYGVNSWLVRGFPRTLYRSARPQHIFVAGEVQQPGGKVEVNLSEAYVYTVRARGGGPMPNVEDKMYDRSAVQQQAEVYKRQMQLEELGGPKEYDGGMLDAQFFTLEEAEMLSVLKVPLLVRLDNIKLDYEMQYEAKRTSDGGVGSGSLRGERALKGKTFSMHTHEAWIITAPDSEKHEYAGRPTLHAGRDKAGSVSDALHTWAGQGLLRNKDGFSMGQLLARLNKGDNYVHMFMKGVQAMKTINMGYTLGKVVESSVSVPQCRSIDRANALVREYNHRVTINMALFSAEENWLLALMAAEGPGVRVQGGASVDINAKLVFEADDVEFVSVAGVEPKWINAIPSPEVYWKLLLSIAEKLGAVKDLVTAYRTMRGLAWQCEAMSAVLGKDIDIGVDVPRSAGINSVMADSNLYRKERVVRPTNLCASFADIAMDDFAGQEACNVFHYAVEEAGYLSQLIYRTRFERHERGVGDSLAREWGLYSKGKKSMIWNAINKRVRRGAYVYLCEKTKELFQRLVRAGDQALRPGKDSAGERLYRRWFNLATTPHYGPIWTMNATVMCGEEVRITAESWGLLAKAGLATIKLRMWSDLYGISTKMLIGGGLGLTGRKDLVELSNTDLAKLKMCLGTYRDSSRAIHLSSNYVARPGYETGSDDRLMLVKTYLGMAGSELDAAPDVQEPDEMLLKMKVTKGMEGVKTSLSVPIESESRAIREIAGLNTKRKAKNLIGASAAIGVYVDPKIDENVNHGVNDTRLTSSFKRDTGLGKFIAKMATEKGNAMHLRVDRVPGDGYCAATALTRALRDAGVDVRENTVKELLRENSPTGDTGWWSIDNMSGVLNHYNTGLVVLDTRTRCLYGIDTMDKSRVIGVTYNGSHFDAITKGGAETVTYDEMLESDCAVLGQIHGEQ